jgi:hypothetical protein
LHTFYNSFSNNLQKTEKIARHSCKNYFIAMKVFLCLGEDCTFVYLLIATVVNAVNSKNNLREFHN